MGPEGTDWAAAAPPVVFDGEEEVDAFADLILSAHERVKESSGCFGATYDERSRAEVLGRLAAVVGNTFIGYFGSGPTDRFGDIFDQAAYLACHLALDHIFPDGNKRTALVMALVLPGMRGAGFRFSDAPRPEENDPYEWVQSVVSRSRTEAELADDLRRWAYIS